MDALVNLLAALLMLVAVYFLWRTPGGPLVRYNMRRAGFALAAAALCQIAVAAWRTWWL